MKAAAENSASSNRVTPTALLDAVWQEEFPS
jgi:hypothetical protein